MDKPPGRPTGTLPAPGQGTNNREQRNAAAAAVPPSDLPLLRRPRGTRKKEPALASTGDAGSNANSTAGSHSGSGTSSIFGLPHADQQQQAVQDGGRLLANMKAGHTAPQLHSVDDLTAYSGDVMVQPRYYPQRPKHAGPKAFPRRPPKQARDTLVSMTGPLYQQQQQLPQPSLAAPRVEESTHAPFPALAHDSAVDVDTAVAASDHYSDHYGNETVGDAALQAHNTAVTLQDDDRTYQADTIADNRTTHGDATVAGGGGGGGIRGAVAAHAKPLVKTYLDKPMLSTHNYRHMPGWKGPAGQTERNTTLHSLVVQAFDAEVVPRVPAHILKLETEMDILEAARQAEKKLKLSEQVDAGGELTLGEENWERLALHEMEDTSDAATSAVMTSKKAVFADGETQYFCGQSRSRSPFMDPHNKNTLSPAQAAVVHSRLRGGKRLNLKAFFIDNDGLPNLNVVMNVTYVNLSFNCLQAFPTALYSASKLQVLTLRNNPICFLPEDFHRMESLVSFSISFCMLERLPETIGELKRLRDLDVSHNMIKFLPESLGNARGLRSLYIVGNELVCMPLSTLALPLKDFRCSENFFHPLFWPESEHNQAQELSVLCRIVARRNRIPLKESASDAADQQERCIKCHICDLDLLDGGLRLIRAPRPRTHNVSKLPFLYRVCSTHCYTELAGDLQSRSTFSK
eukprot:scpid3418/ scgid29135/ Leucine-rich repeat-containing protein 63